MPDFSHAITQLRWLIENDFAERNCVLAESGLGTVPWWSNKGGREDTARLRSYVDAVRLMEGTD